MANRHPDLVEGRRPERSEGKKMKLGVIFGGQSREHEVSVNSAGHVIAAASDRFDVVPIGVTKSGAWLTPDETQRQLDAPSEPFTKAMELEGAQGIVARPEALGVLNEIDVAFPLIHGTLGEDGTLQGFLELGGVAYVGAGVAASAIGMDKGLMKRLLRQAGLDVVEFIVVRSAQYQERAAKIVEAIETSIGYPAFVKPANGGSSVGVSKGALARGHRQGDVHGVPVRPQGAGRTRRDGA